MRRDIFPITLTGSNDRLLDPFSQDYEIIMIGNKGPPSLKNGVQQIIEVEEGTEYTQIIDISEQSIFDPDEEDVMPSIGFNSENLDIFRCDLVERKCIIQVQKSQKPDRFTGILVINDDYQYQPLKKEYFFEVTINAKGSGYMPPIFKAIYEKILSGQSLEGVTNPLEKIFQHLNISKPFENSTISVNNSTNSTMENYYQYILKQLNDTKQTVIPNFPAILIYLNAIQLNSTVKNNRTQQSIVQYLQNSTDYTQMVTWFNESSDQYLTFLVMDELDATKLVNLLQKGMQNAQIIEMDMLKIKKVSQSGVVSISFNFKSNTIIDMIARGALKMMLEDPSGENERVAYSILAMGEDSLQLQLHFEVPDRVSLYQERDILFAEIVQDLILVNKSYTVKLRKGTKRTVEVPPQISEYIQAIIDKVNDALGIATYLLVPGNTLLNVFISGAMSQLYCLLNCLSSLTILSLIPVNIPGPARLLSGAIVQFSQFDMIPTQNLFEWMQLSFSDSDALTLELDGLGFGSMSTLTNLGSTAVYLALNIYAVLTIPIINRLVPQRFYRLKRATQRIFDGTIWSLPLRFFFAQYLTLYLSALVNFEKRDIGDQLLGDRIDKGIANGMLISCSIFPSVIIFSLIIVAKKKLTTPTFALRFGTLTQNLNKSLISQLCTSLELLKLQISILLLLYLRDYPSLQIIALYYISILYQAYLLYFRPYDSVRANVISMINEGLVSVYLLTLVTLTDIQIDRSIKMGAGWGIIANYCLCFIVNLTYMFVHLVARIKDHIIHKMNVRQAAQRSQKYSITVKSQYQRRKIEFGAKVLEEATSKLNSQSLAELGNEIHEQNKLVNKAFQPKFGGYQRQKKGILPGTE
ncbi:hypothetical protein FGO68_gene5291 [Halteria grandinella]|uniref:Uncharacterized protein n=1 Tax=Halteria grandinella TaxID=5974 RepID=A0A8J8SXP0_HALGN|nr:hypothetical protein FGO68_gene5291 [Halteria grandinella]